MLALDPAVAAAAGSQGLSELIPPCKPPSHRILGSPPRPTSRHCSSVLTSRPLCVEGAGRGPDGTHRVRHSPSILLGSEGASLCMPCCPRGPSPRPGHNPGASLDLTSQLSPSRGAASVIKPPQSTGGRGNPPPTPPPSRGQEWAESPPTLTLTPHGTRPARWPWSLISGSTCIPPPTSGGLGAEQMPVRAQHLSSEPALCPSPHCCPSCLPSFSHRPRPGAASGGDSQACSPYLSAGPTAAAPYSEALPRVGRQGPMLPFLDVETVAQAVAPGSGLPPGLWHLRAKPIPLQHADPSLPFPRAL